MSILAFLHGNLYILELPYKPHFGLATDYLTDYLQACICAWMQQDPPTEVC